MSKPVNSSPLFLMCKVCRPTIADAHIHNLEKACHVTLPQGLKHRLCCINKNTSRDFEGLVLRSVGKSSEEANLWLSAFINANGGNNWVVSEKVEDTEKYIFKCECFCRHVNEHGPDNTSHIKSQQQGMCKAAISLIIKKNQESYYFDDHLPDFPMIIRYSNVHNHDIKTKQGNSSVNIDSVPCNGVDSSLLVAPSPADISPSMDEHVTNNVIDGKVASDKYDLAQVKVIVEAVEGKTMSYPKTHLPITDVLNDRRNVKVPLGDMRKHKSSNQPREFKDVYQSKDSPVKMITIHRPKIGPLSKIKPLIVDRYLVSSKPESTPVCPPKSLDDPKVFSSSVVKLKRLSPTACPNYVKSPEKQTQSDNSKSVSVHVVDLPLFTNTGKPIIYKGTKRMHSPHVEESTKTQNGPSRDNRDPEVKKKQKPNKTKVQVVSDKQNNSSQIIDKDQNAIEKEDIGVKVSVQSISVYVEDKKSTKHKVKSKGMEPSKITTPKTNARQFEYFNTTSAKTKTKSVKRAKLDDPDYNPDKNGSIRSSVEFKLPHYLTARRSSTTHRPSSPPSPPESPEPPTQEHRSVPEPLPAKSKFRWPKKAKEPVFIKKKDVQKDVPSTLNTKQDKTGLVPKSRGRPPSKPTVHQDSYRIPRLLDKNTKASSSKVPEEKKIIEEQPMREKRPRKESLKVRLNRQAEEYTAITSTPRKRLSVDVKSPSSAVVKQGRLPSADSVLQVPVKLSEHMKKKFQDLFRFSHGPESSLATHVHDLQTHHGTEWQTVAQDRHACPSKGVVQKLYKQIQNQTSLLQLLSIFLPSMAPDSCIEHLDDCSWYCILVTPLMKRNRSLNPLSSDINYIATYAGRTATLYFVVSNSAAGGLPLAAVITSAKTPVCITSAFRGYARMVEKEPLAFVTEDSGMLRNALNVAFPSSRRIIGLFHILQSAWAFAMNEENRIPDSHQVYLYQVVLNMISARTDLDVLVQLRLANTQAPEIPQIIEYIEQLYQQRRDWCLDFIEPAIRENYSIETSLQLMKNVVLNRLKGFSVGQLAHFIASRSDRYYAQRVCGVLDNGYAITFPGQLAVSSSCPIPKEKISPLGLASNVFLVESKRADTEYFVNDTVSRCSCIRGQTGSLCTHQHAVSLFYGFDVSQDTFASMTPEVKDNMKEIGGEKLTVDSDSSTCDGDVVKFESIDIDLGLDSEVVNIDSSHIDALANDIYSGVISTDFPVNLVTETLEPVDLLESQVLSTEMVTNGSVSLDTFSAKVFPLDTNTSSRRSHTKTSVERKEKVEHKEEDRVCRSISNISNTLTKRYREDPGLFSEVIIMFDKLISGQKSKTELAAALRSGNFTSPSHKNLKKSPLPESKSTSVQHDIELPKTQPLLPKKPLPDEPVFKPSSSKEPPPPKVQPFVPTKKQLRLVRDCSVVLDPTAVKRFLQSTRKKQPRGRPRKKPPILSGQISKALFVKKHGFALKKMKNKSEPEVVTIDMTVEDEESSLVVEEVPSVIDETNVVMESDDSAVMKSGCEVAEELGDGFVPSGEEAGGEEKNEITVTNEEELVLKNEFPVMIEEASEITKPVENVNMISDNFHDYSVLVQPSCAESSAVIVVNPDIVTEETVVVDDFQVITEESPESSVSQTVNPECSVVEEQYQTDGTIYVSEYVVDGRQMTAADPQYVIFGDGLEYDPYIGGEEMIYNEDV